MSNEEAFEKGKNPEDTTKLDEFLKGENGETEAELPAEEAPPVEDAEVETSEETSSETISEEKTETEEKSEDKIEEKTQDPVEDSSSSPTE